LSEDLLPPTPSTTSERSPGIAHSPRRRRGRPLEVQPHEVLGRIRELAGRNALFRVHLDDPALYARARRMFGTWAGALDAAGVDHGAAVQAARQRAVEKRRGRRARPRR
jgi:hypothetical protein